MPIAKEDASAQLVAIAKEIGQIDHDWLSEELHLMGLLDSGDIEYRKEILKDSGLSWQEFAFIWRNYHIYRIGKRMWRKFEKISKKYPNFDTLIMEMTSRS